MIVASHQPNFMPHLGFFYKMFMSDVFTISDDVQYSKRGYHNYNYVCEQGERKKITVPVSFCTGDVIKDVKLSNWTYNREKLKRRLKACYSKSRFYREYYPLFENVLNRSYDTLEELNVELLMLCVRMFGIESKIVFESDLNVSGSTATEQIADICRKTGCSTYLSGTGAKEYLDEECLRKEKVQLVWSAYEPLDYGSVPNASVLDYIMNCGATVPESWKEERKKLRNG